MRSTSWLIPFMAIGLAAAPACHAAGRSPGSSTNASVDASKLGSPIYPGAVLDNDYGPNKYTSRHGQIDAHFITTDAFAKVYAFYKKHMPANSAKPYTDPMTGATFAIGETSDPDYIEVTLMVETDQNGKPAGTQIDQMHVTQDQK